MENSIKYRILKSGFNVISRYKLRTFFMMLGIIIGISALTLTLTLGNGIEKKILDNVSRLFNNNNVFLSSERVETEGVRVSEEGPNTSLKIHEIDAIADQLEGLIMYDYLHMLPEQNIIYKENYISANIQGCQEIGELIWRRDVEKGEFFNKSDVNGSKRVALLGPKVAAALFPNEDPIGKQIRISNSPYIVGGVLTAKGADPHGNDMDMDVLIPITTFMRRLANVDYIMGAKFEFESKELAMQSEAIIRSQLRDFHSRTAGEADDFEIITAKQVSEIVAEMTKLFKVLLPAIAAIALLAGAIVIVVLMSMSVNQRVREIGLRKALGAKNKQIRLQFIAEGTIVVFIGGVLGLIIGLVLSNLMSEKMNATFYIPIQSIIIGLLLPVVTGLIAGILPANKAAKYDPVESLKN